MLAKELPPKWDLADPLPEGKGERFVKDAILRASEKAVGMDALQAFIKALSKPIDLGFAQAVLWRVEEKMRLGLEEKYAGKRSELTRVLLDETIRTLQDNIC